MATNGLRLGNFHRVQSKNVAHNLTYSTDLRILFSPPDSRLGISLDFSLAFRMRNVWNARGVGLSALKRNIAFAFVSLERKGFTDGLSKIVERCNPPSPPYCKMESEWLLLSPDENRHFLEKKNFQDPEPGYRRCAAVTSTECRVFLYSCTMRIIFLARAEVK